MKMWSKSDENQYEFQINKCPLHQLFMGFVKPTNEWSKSNENRYGYQLRCAESNSGHKIGQ